MPGVLRSGGLLADFDRYIASAPADPVGDASYRVAGLWLTDEEVLSLARDLSEVFQPRLANAQGKGRRHRMLYTVFLPAAERDSGG